MSEPELVLVFSNSENPELIRTEFRHPLLRGEMKKARRGKPKKGRGQPSEAFGWSSGVKALVLFLLPYVVWGLRRGRGENVPRPVFEGKRQTPASSLEQAVNQPSNAWLASIFGGLSTGISHLRPLLEMTGTGLSRDQVPVGISLNLDKLPASSLKVLFDGDKQPCQDVSRIENLIDGVRRQWGRAVPAQTTCVPTHDDCDPLRTPSRNRVAYVIKLDDDFHALSPGDREQRLREVWARVRDDLCCSTAEPKRIEEGCVKITLELTSEEAERLGRALDAGALDDLFPIGHGPAELFQAGNEADDDEGGPDVIVVGPLQDKGQARPRDLCRPGRQWVIVVGVGRYADPPGMPALPGVVEDAGRLIDVFRDHGAAPLIRTHALLNENATRDRVIDTLHGVARESLESDLVLFWFGGHGHRSFDGDGPLPDRITRYLLPHDATHETAAVRGISTRQLGEALSGLRASEVVVVLDCCHRGREVGPFWCDLSRLTRGAGNRHVMAATRPWHEPPGGRSFTHYFCEALAGHARGLAAPDGRVSSAAAFGFAHRRLLEGDQPPENGVEASDYDTGGAIWLARVGSAPHLTSWHPRVCYPLQPTPHFEGRESLRGRLLRWAREWAEPDRVVSLVGAWGVGKSALAELVLRELSGQAPAGVLAWSFHEDPRADHFLRTAYAYLTRGEVSNSASTVVDELERAWIGEEPHLLVLDGLDRVQAAGSRGRRGEVEDPGLRRLLCSLAATTGARTRVLVTSRLPLTDLDRWRGTGYREERLSKLEPQAARAVLRGWGVRGDDRVLDRLVEPLHHHALSVDMLGSYLGKLCGGDPDRSHDVIREGLTSESESALLDRILARYVQKLSVAERDLMAHLGAFPRGVTLGLLRLLYEAGGTIPETLAGADQDRLLRRLQRLRDLGLVFRYDGPEGATFTTHLSLRDYFRGLFGVSGPGRIPGLVPGRMVPGSRGRPGSERTDGSMLDRYEPLIEQVRLAGHTRVALELFEFGLGPFQTLPSVLADNVRGLRIAASFSPDGSPEAAATELPDRERGDLVTAWGVFAKNLGDLATARRAFSLNAELRNRKVDGENLSRALLNQAGVELLAGRLPAAVKAATAALAGADRAQDVAGRRDSHAHMACALARLGKPDEAHRHFTAATALADSQQLISLAGVWEAEIKLACGDRVGAAAQARNNREAAEQDARTRDRALCDTLLGLLMLPEDPVVARQYLDRVRSDAIRSGDVEVQLRCYHLASEIERAERNYEMAQSEAEAGIQLADAFCFGHYSVHLRMTLARALLDAGIPGVALWRAREALEWSIGAECQYGWGEADALHLCGVAHARLGEIELARECLTSACAKRRRLIHPGLPDSQTELHRIDSLG